MAAVPFDVERLERNQHFRVPHYFERQAQARLQALLARSALLAELTNHWQQRLDAGPQRRTPYA